MFTNLAFPKTGAPPAVASLREALPAKSYPGNGQGAGKKALRNREQETSHPLRWCGPSGVVPGWIKPERIIKI
jgi:hypothetical protein